MFQILQSVQVTKKDHERYGQAGAVWEILTPTPELVMVRFDVDEAVELVEVADLRGL